VTDAADSLRIQARYLQAIEDGRFHDLPGPTYALGFVRAYADFLDLDGKEIVRQFKEEGQGVSRRQALVFPEPVQEGRFPGGTVLLMALVLAGAVYGGWYYWQQRPTNTSGEIPPVPTGLANLAATKPPANSVGEATAPATSPSSAQASLPAATGSSQSGTTAGGAQPVAAAPSVAPAPSASAPAVPPAKESPAPTSSTAAAPPQQTPSVPSQTSPGAPPSVTVAASPAVPPSAAVKAPPAPVAEPAPKPAEAPVAAETPKPAPPPPATPSGGSAESTSSAVPAAPEQLAVKNAAEPRVYGETNSDSRITLTAKQDSWVQVRDSESNVLWTRILRPGDTYKVPNQPGLMLYTGNAGALDVTVDGKPAPPLGAVGAVRRNITLDPEKLASGAGAGQ
jgi:cytoskeletal protein RodZ